MYLYHLNLSLVKPFFEPLMTVLILAHIGEHKYWYFCDRLIVSDVIGKLICWSIHNFKCNILKVTGKKSGKLLFSTVLAYSCFLSLWSEPCPFVLPCCTKRKKKKRYCAKHLLELNQKQLDFLSWVLQCFASNLRGLISFTDQWGVPSI